MNLRNYPVLSLKPRSRYQTRFILRIEENIPVPIDGKLPLFKDVLCSVKNVRLLLLSTEKRNLAYEIVFKREEALPRIVYRDWYVLAFYGTKISSVHVLFQDNNLRLVRGGNGNVYGLILRRHEGGEEGEMEEQL